MKKILEIRANRKLRRHEPRSVRKKAAKQEESIDISALLKLSTDDLDKLISDLEGNNEA